MNNQSILVRPPEHSFSRTHIPRGTRSPNTVSGPNTRTRVLEHTFSAELSHPNTRTQPEHTNTEIRRVLEHAFSNTLYDVSNTAPNTKRLPTGRVLEHAFSNTRTHPNTRSDQTKVLKHNLNDGKHRLEGPVNTNNQCLRRPKRKREEACETNLERT